MYKVAREKTSALLLVKGEMKDNGKIVSKNSVEGNEVYPF